MDEPFFSHISLLSQLYAMKYSNARFDAILSLDDDALRFLLQYGLQIFPQTPVVFCGVAFATLSRAEATNRAVIFFENTAA